MADPSTKEIAALKKAAQDLDPAVQIGKAGLTPGVVEEVRAQLEREPLVKVKLLKSALGDLDRREFGARLAAEVGAALVEVRGFTVVLYRDRRRRKSPRTTA